MDCGLQRTHAEAGTPHGSHPQWSRKTSEKEGGLEDGSGKQGVAGISTCLASTSSIPSLQGLRIACDESKESGNKGVETGSTKVKSRDEAENVFS